MKDALGHGQSLMPNEGQDGGEDTEGTSCAWVLGLLLNGSLMVLLHDVTCNVWIKSGCRLDICVLPQVPV